jgi:ABC-2 type transport system ATP-binding protein/Cu-processing system ATP-binding protein
VKETIVTMANVSKAYDKRDVVKKISLEIERGEIFCLLGHNGAGKSTLIKMLTGLIQKSSGSIQISGKEITPFQKEAKAQFSYLPEIMSLFPHLNAKETLHFFAQLQKVPEKREDEVLELVGLSEYRNEKVGNFSKGMTQRIGFAIALLPQTPLLILDEPTSGLDSFWSIQFKKIIKKLNEQGTTIIFASHILSEIEDLADRVAIVSNGELIALGTIPQLKSNVVNEIKIVVSFAEPIHSQELQDYLNCPVTVQKDGYQITCKREDKLRILSSIQGFGELIDFEVQEISLEDIYQEILQQKYASG